MRKKVVRLTESQLKEMVKESVKMVIDEEAALKLDNNAEQLIEMARIDAPSHDNRILGTREVWVYGQDRSSMSPHFHYFNKKNNQFNVEVKISDLTVCFSQPRIGVPQNKLMSWIGLSDDKKVLIEWLQQPNCDLPSITNYQAIKLAWNQNNRDNPVG